jgi:hypothetical protein
MKEVLFDRMGDESVHMFGHIHGCGGVVKEMGPGSLIDGEGPRTIFSNAACSKNVFEIRS